MQILPHPLGESGCRYADTPPFPREEVDADMQILPHFPRREWMQICRYSPISLGGSGCRYADTPPFPSEGVDADMQILPHFPRREWMQICRYSPISLGGSGCRYSSIPLGGSRCRYLAPLPSVWHFTFPPSLPNFPGNEINWIVGLPKCFDKTLSNAFVYFFLSENYSNKNQLCVNHFKCN
jgi:hypothetical protein